MKQNHFNPFTDEIRRQLIDAFEKEHRSPLPPAEIKYGCGVYAIYYNGKFKAYSEISNSIFPIYIGKAVPPGGRKGGGRLETIKGPHVIKRLKEHAKSIGCSKNLSVEDFECRWLSVVESFVSTAEVILINHYQPIWNLSVSGFGIHDPGKGRYNQVRSDWDMLHPGRNWAEKLPFGKSSKEVLKNISAHVKRMKEKA